MENNSSTQQEIEKIVALLNTEDREHIRGLTEGHLAALHPTLGRALRNAFRSNVYPHLFTYCNEWQDAHTHSFDSMSSDALTLI